MFVPLSVSLKALMTWFQGVVFGFYLTPFACLSCTPPCIYLGVLFFFLSLLCQQASYSSVIALSSFKQNIDFSFSPIAFCS